MKYREQYYRGYLAAIQDLTRMVDEDTWVLLAEALDHLTTQTIRDVIRETQIEDKVP